MLEQIYMVSVWNIIKKYVILKNHESVYEFKPSNKTILYFVTHKNTPAGQMILNTYLARSEVWPDGIHAKNNTNEKLIIIKSIMNISSVTTT